MSNPALIMIASLLLLVVLLTTLARAQSVAPVAVDQMMARDG